MPNLANITVKRNDGTTDVIWTGVNPQGSSPAVHRSLSVGVAMDHRPEIRSNVKSAGKMDSCVFTCRWPEIATNSTTTITSVISAGSARLEMDIPKSMAQTTVDEFVAQFLNVVGHALNRQLLRERAGYN